MSADERRADERQRLADQRETAADERERLADQRETAADERERFADQRGTAADERERLADQRETKEAHRVRGLADLATTLEAQAHEAGEATAQKVTLSRATVARTQALLAAVRERLARSGAAREREMARDEREISSIERQILATMSATGNGVEVRSQRVADLRVHADELRRHEQQLRGEIAAGLPDLSARRAAVDTHLQDQLERAAEIRRNIAATALAIAEVEDEVAVNLDLLAATSSPDRAESRSGIAQRARDFAKQERVLAKEYGRE